MITMEFRVFKVRCNGIIIDDRYNSHHTIEQAQKYYEHLFKFIGNDYDIVEIQTVQTIHPIYEG